MLRTVDGVGERPSLFDVLSGGGTDLKEQEIVGRVRQKYALVSLRSPGGWTNEYSISKKTALGISFLEYVGAIEWKSNIELPTRDCVRPSVSL